MQYAAYMYLASSPYLIKSTSGLSTNLRTARSQFRGVLMRKLYCQTASGSQFSESFSLEIEIELDERFDVDLSTERFKQNYFLGSQRNITN